MPDRRRYRWSLRHRLRARRVAQYTGWQPGELAALMAPTRADAEYTALAARLAADMRAVVRRGQEDILSRVTVGESWPR